MSIHSPIVARDSVPLMEAGALIAHPDLEREEADSTVVRLSNIFQHIQRGDRLDPGEALFLERVSERRPSLCERMTSLFVTPADHHTVTTINTLAERALDGRTGREEVFSQVRDVLTTSEDLSARTEAALAALIKCCSLRRAEFSTSLSDYRETRRGDFNRGDLIQFVQDFNMVTIPQPARAGEIVASIEVPGEDAKGRSITITYQACYGADGNIELRNGSVGPLDLECRQVLSEAQVGEMIAIYKRLTTDVPYDNLGELMEFARFYREEKARDPTLTMGQIYEAYRPDLLSIYDKYGSGTCIILATKFAHELERIHVKTQSMGTFALNSSSRLPIPGTETSPMKWFDYSQEVEGAEHTSSVCFYLDESGKKNVLSFECSFEKDKPDEISHYQTRRSYSGVSQFLSDKMMDDLEFLKDRVLDPAQVGKARLKGRSKGVMMRDGKNFGIDFLTGNIYINPSWSRERTGIPLNARGIASIRLEDLTTPDAKGEYFVNGVKVEMSHREALKIILSEVRTVMPLPEDAEENLITLATTTDMLFSEVLLDPLPFIREVHSELSFIAKRIKEMEARDSGGSTEELSAIHAEHDSLIVAIAEHNLSRAREIISSLYAQLEVR